MGMRLWKRCIATIIVATMMITMSGCGKEDHTQKGNQMGEDFKELTYEGTTLKMDEMEGEPNSCFVKNRKLYIQTCQLIEGDNLSEENNNIEEKFFSRLYTANLDGSDLYEIPLNLADGEYMNTYLVGNDGSITYIVINDEPQKKYHSELVKLDADGKELLRADVTTSLQLGEDTQVSKILMDAKENIIVVCNSKVHILDQKFESVDEVMPADGYRIVDTALTKSGQIVCVEDKFMSEKVSLQVRILDVDVRKWGEPLKLDVSNVSGSDFIMDGLDNYDFYYKSDSGICGYDIAGTESKKLMDYNASNLFSEETDGMAYIGDEKFIICTSDFERDDENVGLFVYSKVDPSAVSNKKTIIVGTMFADDHMKKAAIEFNRRYKDCQIEFKEYYQEEDPSTQMNLDVVAGDVADVIDISSMPLSAEQCVTKGLVEDLTPYFEKDSVLNTDDMIDSVLEAMKINGKLYYVASGFTINSIVGKTKDVGDGTGWTFDEWKTLLKEKDENVSIFYSEDSKTELLYTFLGNGLTDFVDWENGECGFDSQDFKDILEICNKKGTNEEAEMSETEIQETVANAPSRLREGKVLLEVAESLSVEQIQIDRQKFGEDITYIGYPNKEKLGTYYNFDRQIGICSKSDMKDEAWEFIRIFMTKDYQGKNMTYAMPTRQDCFDLNMKEKMATNSYIDEFGREIEPLEGTWMWGDIEMKQKPVSQEEVDMFVALVNNTKTCGNCDEEMLNIILEESQVYFAGRKKLDKTVAIIQKRISTYVNEQH